LQAATAAGALAAGKQGKAASKPGDPSKVTLGSLRLIDLSVAIEDGAPGEMTPPKIEYISPDKSGPAVAQIFGAKPSDLIYSRGHGWAVETLTASSHTGTHIDAPYHYGAMSEGKPARRIDEVPLEWFFGPGVVFDMRSKKPGEMIRIADLQAELKRIGYKLKPGDIALIHTGAATRWGTKEYFEQPGLGRESTLWLVEQGVKVIGIDAWTLDRPFSAMAADFHRTGDGRVIWEAHFAGLTREYCQIEKLANIDQLPAPFGFYISCLPVKIKSASAGWCRAVALVPQPGGRT
jgi:kynurenine formamidase